MGERHDVVRYGRLSDNPDGGTITAERFGAETAKSLGYPATSTKPLSHPPPLKRTTPESLWTPGAVLNPLFRKVYSVGQVRSIQNSTLIQ